MSARNRELFALIPAALLVSAGFAAVFLSRDDLLGGLSGTNRVSNVSLTYGAIFLGLCVAAHLVLRVTLRHADPYLFPLCALLASFGLVEIYRIDDGLARLQAQWFVIGLILFAGTIILLRDYRRLERYRYLIAIGGIALLLLPRAFPPVNGAYLSIRIGSLSVQPAEFAKIAMVIFLASYLRDTRQLLVTAGRRVVGVTIPPLKHFGPLLVIWGTSMLLLFYIRDIGSSVMFFGAFLAMIYVATDRLSFVVVGVGIFALGGYLVAGHIGHIADRVDAWRHPFDPKLLQRASGGSYQLAQGLWAQADGGVLGQGFGQAVLRISGNPECVSTVDCSLLPAPHTDFIYAVIVNELGLAGAAGLLGVYLLVVQRGFKIAMLARDSFSKLLATGLTSVFAIQVFVIVGGVTKLIPLTGVTLPFVSYGGSSVLANFVLLALLLLVSDRARRPDTGAGA
ncbi:FtsW/RodA/SpoVE family cell cycle protein [Baekduia soli]|uniref:FtsW/RodA/SpoVE family cell cycle protein n=1 Tax=Baekduia soli TaxID=496014 RepID=A0A5B8U1J1_9ACTN|nr:FtsW/RodA/SpoVE family cell cycle protein [Baekduia soli]QEC46810.1 FtsW/RodA/SpoVE family cell cycle protein [Baekduia soli]